MKKEYIFYYYAKIFKGNIDEGLFDAGHARLLNIIIEKNLTLENENLKSFTEIYYEICNRMLQKIEGLEEIVFGVNNDLGLVKKLKNKYKLKAMKKSYYNALEFAEVFATLFGVRFIDVKKFNQIEKIIDHSNNGVW